MKSFFTPGKVCMMCGGLWFCFWCCVCGFGLVLFFGGLFGLVWVGFFKKTNVVIETLQV